MRALLRDLRHAWRSLRHRPALTLVAILALTLGIGLTTMMLTIVYGALLRGLPFPDGDRIMIVQRTDPARGIDGEPLPLQDYADLRAQQHSFTALGAFAPGAMFVSGYSGSAQAERVDGSWISANAFDILGATPFLGRTFRPGEDTPAAERVVIIGWGMWRDRYDRDPHIVGKAIRVNGEPYTVIGVMPERFAFPIDDQIWLPLQTDPLATPRGQGPLVQTFGKLAPGVSRARAARDVATIAARLATTYKESNAGVGARVVTFADAYLGNGRHTLFTMLGAVLFVLLIACANVANLLLDRAAQRTRETGIRIALGASRGAVVRQCLAESLILSSIATALGVGVAQLGIDAFNRARAAVQLPFFVDIRLHPQVLVFTVVVCVATALLAGVIPALRSSRADINDVLKDESRGASSLRIGRVSRMLVVFEVAMSCSLLVGAGLMIRSLMNLRQMDLGFTTANVFTARVGFPPSDTDTAAQGRFFDQLLDGIATVPGVQAAALSSGLPAADVGLADAAFTVEGQTYAKDTDHPVAQTASVTPRLFEVLHTPIVSGRAFTPADRAGSLPVAIVNQAFARRYLPGLDPIGHRVRLESDRPLARPLDRPATWLTIVGIARNTFVGDQADPMAPALFRPLAQAPAASVYLAAKTASAPLAITQDVRAVVRSLDPDLPVYRPQSLDDAIAASFTRQRVLGPMFTIFGLAALFLAMVGLYAVMSFSVSHRTRELGIRMALGARGGHVVRMIVGQGARQIAAGMAAGMGLAFLVAGAIQHILFEVDAHDPIVFGAVAAMLGVVALVACLIPAVRATLIDPLVAMRAE